jgi:hypothetical protein
VELRSLERQLADLMRRTLASAGASWTRSRLVAEDLDGGFAVGFRYETAQGTVHDDVDIEFDAASEVVKAILPLTPHADGRRWTRGTFEVTPHGEVHSRFEYPPPPPVKGQTYSEAEVVARIAESLRAIVSKVAWTEAWIESDEEYGHTPFIEYSSPQEGPKEGLQDCHFLRRWHKELMDCRRRAGLPLWKTGRLRIWPDGTMNASFDGAAEAVEVTAGEVEQIPTFEELVHEIKSELCHELLYFVRVLREKGAVGCDWRQTRITAHWRDELQDADCEYRIEFDDGTVIDTFGDEEVEQRIGDILIRIADGEHLAPLSAAGAAVDETGKTFRFVVANPAPAGGSR